MATLLVSVRDATEVEFAISGADILDVKEPLAGPLGRATDAAREAILDAVGGRVPVSVACGELIDDAASMDLSRIAFVKYGLAGCAGLDWQDRLRQRRLAVEIGACRMVAVAYADWKRAEAPPPTEVFHFAAHERFAAVLIDTWGKDGSTLLDWMPVPQVAAHCEVARSAGLRVALAGSLGRRHIETLRQVDPDWFAVRGSVCVRGSRSAGIDAERVRELAELLSRVG